ncbi:MAG: CBS domain-containing protein [Rhodomicrobiaceae bacterium]
MKAADIMTKDVVTVSDQSYVQDAAKLLLQHRISALPVVDSAGGLVGIVSEGDLIRRVESGTQHQNAWWLEMLADADSLARQYVREHSRKIVDIMTRSVVTAKPDADLGDIANLLEKHGIKRVPIVEDGRIVGIVSRSNLIQALAALDKGIAIKGKPDDAAIRDQVLARLKAESWRPFLINVIVHNGKVDLWGIANSPAQKTAARVVAEVTPGVTAVNDNLIVRPVAFGE